jgi:hypothetical protein
LLRFRNRGLTMLFFILSAAVAISVNSSPVLADSCSAQIGYSPPTSSYYSGNMVLVVPVVAKCSITHSQLYATGDLYDTSTNTDLGSSGTILNSPYGGNTYGGQIGFMLSPSVQGHTLRITVSIYSDQQYTTQLTTVARTAQIYPSSYYGYGPCFSCDYDYNLCQSTFGSTTQCSGFLYQDQNGCLEIVIPVNSPVAGQVYQHYTLQNMTSTYPLVGSWITVTGQVHQGYNVGPYGVACPGNYITVTSIE